MQKILVTNADAGHSMQVTERAFDRVWSEKGYVRADGQVAEGQKVKRRTKAELATLIEAAGGTPVEGSVAAMEEQLASLANPVDPEV